MSKGRRILRIHPELLIEMFKGEGPRDYEVLVGLPTDVKLLECEIDPGGWENGIVLTLESPAWEGPLEGETIPDFNVNLGTVPDGPTTIPDDGSGSDSAPPAEPPSSGD